MRVANATTLILGLLLVEGLLAQEVSLAQDLSIKRELPPLPSNACEARGYVYGAASEPSAEAQTEADRLASEASQAAILGETERARALLDQATELNPASASISYSFGRLLESAGEQEAALAEFCRFLAIAPGVPETADVEQRIESVGMQVGALGMPPSRAAFEEGIRSFDEGDYDQSVLDFSRALVELPEWEEAHFNRAVAYLNSGRQAAGAADLEFYLELAPDADDRLEVEALLEELGPLTAQYSPRTAFVSGMFIPGMGHFYTGRPALGILVLGAAGASAGFAILQKEVEISCASPPVNGECSDVLSQEETRPLLVPGLAAAAAITILGAIHASRGARQSAVQLSAGGGVERSLPAFSFRGWEPTLRVEPAVGSREHGLRAELEIRF